MHKANEELRKELYEKHIPFWKLGAVIGVSEMTIIRWFRVPLTAEHMQRVRGAINAICGEG